MPLRIMHATVGAMLRLHLDHGDLDSVNSYVMIHAYVPDASDQKSEMSDGGPGARLHLQGVRVQCGCAALRVCHSGSGLQSRIAASKDASRESAAPIS